MAAMPVNLRWVLDVGLPRPLGNGLDALHAMDQERRPGCVGLTEATRLERVLVTRDQGFRGPWHLPVAHPGIVILEDRSLSPEELVRNLLHLQFCLLHDREHAGTASQRFVIKVDRAILHVHDDVLECRTRC